MLQPPEPEAFTGHSRCEAADTQAYSLYFKGSATRQRRCSVDACLIPAQGRAFRARHCRLLALYRDSRREAGTFAR